MSKQIGGLIAGLALIGMIYGALAHAARVEYPDQRKTYIDLESGKQIDVRDIYREAISKDKAFLECRKVEVVFNGNNGKPSLKPVK